MREAKIIELQEALFGIALNAAIVGVPLDVMDRHFHRDGRTRVSPQSPGYPCLLREAIEDIKAAAIERCGVPAEVVLTWGPIGVDDALAAAERLNNRARMRRDPDQGAV
jgi:hypothetical protein